MQPEHRKRLSRSERYRRKINGLRSSLENQERAAADLLAILDSIAPELSSERQSTIRLAVAEIQGRTAKECGAEENNK